MHQLLILWLILANAFSFLLMAWDKFQAGRADRRRVSELHLAAIGAIGGWPGGLLAMLLLRHKTTKLSFQLKYAVALVIWTALICGAWVWLWNS